VSAKPAAWLNRESGPIEAIELLVPETPEAEMVKYAGFTPVPIAKERVI
jgi:hypothetical protein